MSENQIVLSVIIPVYNAEDVIRETLDSVLGQSLKEIEVICVDDGSVDDSVEIIREYTEKDPRVKLLQQKNQYAGIARNTGIEAARGEWLYFLDADDYVLDYGLEAVCGKATKHRLDFLKFMSLTYDEKEEKYSNKKRNNGGFLKPEDYDRLVTLGEGTPLLRVSVTPWSGIYRRAFVMEKNCRFNGLRCVNDRSFYTKIMTNAERMMIVRDRVTVHRENQDSSLVGKKAKYFDCQTASLRITEEQLKADGIDREIAELIMRQEYQDCAFWYRKYNVSEEQREKMDALLDEYYETAGSEYDSMLKSMIETARQAENRPAPYDEVKPYHKDCAHPAVSVLVPAEDAEDTLNETLESLKNQTLEDIEVILLNNGSGDGTLTVMKEYELLDKRFKIIDSEKTGYGALMNKGLAQARGEFIGIVQANDCCEPEMYERMVHEARLHRLDIAKCDTVRFRVNENGMPETREVLPPASAQYGVMLNPAKDKYLFQFHVHTESAVFRKAMLDKNGIRFNEDAGTLFRDNGFWYQTLWYAKKMRLIQEPLYRERADEPGALAIRGDDEQNMTEEYRFIHRRLDADRKAKSKFEGITYDRQLSGMFHVWSRLAPERKLPYLQQIREEMQEAYTKDLFDRDYLQRKNTERLEMIMDDPQKIMELTDISVIIAADRFTEEALERYLLNLLSQSAANIEVIGVTADEESAQGRAMKRWEARDSRVRVYTAGGGTGGARNEGLKHAKGTWCTFPDGGAFYEADMTDRAWNRAEARVPEIEVLPTDNYDEETGVYSGAPGYREELLPQRRPFGGTGVAKNAYRGMTGWAWDKLFKTEYLKEKGLQFPNDAELCDGALVMAAIARAERIDILNTLPLAHRRVNSSEKTGAATGQKAVMDGYVMLEGLKENLQRSGEYTQMVEKGYINYALHYSLRQLEEAPNEEVYRGIYEGLKSGWLDKLGITMRSKRYFYEADDYDRMKKMKDMEALEFLLYDSRRKADRIEELTRIIPEEENLLMLSAPYLIGRAFSLIPKKIKTGRKLIKDHGVMFVAKYGLSRMKLFRGKM